MHDSFHRRTGLNEGAGAADRVRPAVLVLTNLYPVPWEPTRGTFNAQRFDWLAKEADLTIAVALPIREVIRHRAAFWRSSRGPADQSPELHYFAFLALPRPLAWLNAGLYFVAFCVQRPRLAFMRRWDCLIGSWLYPDAVATALLGLLRKLPLVSIAHGTDGNVLTRLRDRRPQIRWMLGRASRALTVSAALRDVLIGCGASPDRTSVVYTGIDSSRFSPVSRSAARRECGVDEAANLVLFVGSLIPTKGTRELVSAALELLGESERWAFAIIGSGPEGDFIRSAFSGSRFSHRLVMPGRVPNRELARWYAAADVFCLPSHREGVPNVVIEAMACGTPVVATRVGGIPEVVPEFAGILIDPCDPTCLSTALRLSVARRWEPSRIVAYSGRFSWRSNAEQTMAVIDASIASHRVAKDAGEPVRRSD